MSDKSIIEGMQLIIENSILKDELAKLKQSSENDYNDMRRFQGKVIALSSELAELKEHLREIEWHSDGGRHLWCHACGGRDKHKDECWLAKAVKGEGK